jgi:molybdopterin-guanine dinucleotide biosynthesis protein A
MMARAFTALVLAGSRPGGDPLAKALGVSHKALLPIAGRPMLAWVVDALRGADRVERLAVCGLDRAAIEGTELAPLLTEAAFVGAGETPGASVARAMDELDDCLPLLVTTGDHPLLRGAIVDEFCAAAVTRDADVVVGVVDGESVRKVFPGAARTYGRLRGGTYHGANLFAFLSADAKRAARRWMEIERQRKQPWKMVRALGAATLLRFATRRLSLDDLVALVAEKMDVRIASVLVADAEAGFDVDKPSHVGEVERVLSARAGRDR